MIGFSPPTYVEINGASLAVFTVDDMPGGQYVYRNRDMDWLRALMADQAPHGVVRATNFNHDHPTADEMTDPEALSQWWQSQMRRGPFIRLGEGCVVRVLPSDERVYPLSYRMPGNLFVYVLCYGQGSEWVNGDPLYSLWSHGLPRKTRSRRKWEVQGKGDWREPSRSYRDYPDLYSRERDIYRNIYSPSTPESERFRRLTDHRRGTRIAAAG